MGFSGTYRRLFENAGDVETVEEREKQYISGKGQFFATQMSLTRLRCSDCLLGFNAISESIQLPKLGSILFPKTGLTTGDNERYLRLWFEVSKEKIGKKWFYLNKGGEFRKWYGNNEYVLNWEHDGAAIKSASGSTIRNSEFYFRDGVTWSKITA